MTSINNYQFYPKLILRKPVWSYRDGKISLAELLNNSFFRSAILLASKSLYKALEKNSFNLELLTPKQELTLRMYFNRMCFRPTPFGLFSEFAVIEWQLTARKVRSPSRMHIQLDNLFLADLIGKKGIGNHEKLILNCSLYKVGNEYRYLRSAEGQQEQERTFYIDSIEATIVLVKIISFLRKGRLWHELVTFLLKECQADESECDSFVQELINSQVIVPELTPNITGQEYFERLVSMQNGLQAAELNGIKNIMENLNAGTSIIDPGNLIEADRLLEGLNIRGKKTPLYVNLENPGFNPSLPDDVQAKLLEGLSCIDKLLPHKPVTSFVNFVAAFKRKFDLQTIPLLVALDPETGIGYDSAAAEYDSSAVRKDWQIRKNLKTSEYIEWSEVHALLLNKWQRKLEPKEGISAIELDGKDLEHLPESTIDVAPSTSILFRNAGKLVYIEQAGGATATALIGRFTPLNADIKKAALDIASIEERTNPDVLFAEINHISDPSHMIIEKRASIRKYEIPILTASTLPEENQIPLNDLFLFIQGDEIILWSQKLQKKIIPRLTSAYNYLRSCLPVYRFLCDLQHQGIKSGFSFDFPSLFPNLSFYPRLQYKDVIISLASWHLTKDDVEVLTRMENREEKLLSIMEFAYKMKWPRYISVNRGDQYIVIDLKREADMLLLPQILKKENKIIIQEFPFINDDRLTRKKQQKPFVQQFLAQLYHTNCIYGTSNCCHPVDDQKGNTRKLVPGSDWLYFKIYCHPKISNEILLNYIVPYMNGIIKKELVKQWFFVRYFDSSYHLRIRINLDASSIGFLINRMSEKLIPLVSSGQISDLQIGVYERELERYHRAMMSSIEKSFCCSSDLTLAFFKNRSVEKTGAVDLYEMAFCSLNVIVEAFLYNEEKKIRLFKLLFENMSSEFNGASVPGYLQNKFRETRQATGIIRSKQIINKFQIGAEILSFQRILSQIEANVKGWEAGRQERLVADIMHMHLNRLFPAGERKNELTVYYFMWKYLESASARRKKNSGKSFCAY